MELHASGAIHIANVGRPDMEALDTPMANKSTG
jgi:hypothetical protein